MKERLDILMVQQGLAPSREKAKAIILAGEVLINDEVIDKPATLLDLEGIAIRIKTRQLKYVSRAGFKLEKGLEEFNIDVAGKVCLDIGASTGGFTDCLLQNNARKVYAIDVGTNQLDWKIRSDSRVICHEKMNFRYIKPDVFKDKINFACCDVSFISLDKIIPPLRDIIDDHGEGIILIKPQFEATREQVNKGKINDPLVHHEVIDKVLHLMIDFGFDVLALTFSPIPGNKKANIEFVTHIRASDHAVCMVDQKMISEVIANAWKTFK